MARIHTPIGMLKVSLNEKGQIYGVCFVSAKEHAIPSAAPATIEPAHAEHATNIHTEITEYFRGQRSAFTCSFVLTGGTFATRVWREIMRIKYGSLISYSALAQKCGIPTATRAVAHAVACNPIPILIPCHRVIRKDRSIGEYALHTLGESGREVKKYLINLEASTFSGSQGM